MKKLMLTAALCTLLTSCAGGGDKGTKSENEPRKVAVSELNADSAELYDYIFQKGWGEKFILSEGIKINDVSELYSFSLRETADFEKVFPEYYSYLYGRDFYKDSGVSDISKLPVNDYTGGLLPFSKGQMYGEIQYIDLHTVDPADNSYITSMYAYPNGKLYFESDAYFFPGNHFKDRYYVSKGCSDTEYRMLDGTEWTLNEACSFAEKTYNELYGKYSPDFSFEPYMAIPNERGENFYFTVIMRRKYGGVPFKCCKVSKDTDEIQSKPMFYICYFYGKEKLTAMVNTTGTEDIIEPVRITDKVIPVTSALDILDEVLAPHIRLEIEDISLVYYNSYDASAYAELVKRMNSAQNYTPTKEENLMLGQPEGMPGTEFDCFPAWEFKLKKEICKSDDGLSSETFYETKAVYVNALTGEVIPYI